MFGQAHGALSFVLFQQPLGDRAHLNGQAINGDGIGIGVGQKQRVGKAQHRHRFRQGAHLTGAHPGRRQALRHLDQLARLRQEEIHLEVGRRPVVVDGVTAAPQGKKDQILQQLAVVGRKGEADDVGQARVNRIDFFGSNLLALDRKPRKRSSSKLT